jgi:hypothetical protein
MTTLPLGKLISRSPLRLGFLLIPLAVAFFALSPTAEAVNPPPDGGYPSENTAEGDYALYRLTGGGDNTAIGFRALLDNTNGNYNTAIGVDALESNNTGEENTASGVGALNHNTTGGGNTANGSYALWKNATGGGNTANGLQALYSNTAGNYNTATGINALYSNTGTNNTANGASALFTNTSGGNNVASGVDALYFNTTGYYNTADGDFALYHNTIGHDNTGSGNQTLFNNTSGNFNIALGNLAGYSLTKGSNNIDIGNQGLGGESGKIRIGTKGTHTATFVAGIYGKTVASGVGVIVNANGQLGTMQSSARYKEAIKPMDKASEALLKLKPVTFHYKAALDPDAIPQFGLIAEQVEKVNPDLVVRDEEGKVMTVRYEAVNAMLLNEFLKEHSKVEEEDQKLRQLEAVTLHQQKEIEALTATLKEQDLQIQKMSTQVAAAIPVLKLAQNQ